jgi:hypothetical protein
MKKILMDGAILIIICIVNCKKNLQEPRCLCSADLVHCRLKKTYIFTIIFM